MEDDRPTASHGDQEEDAEDALPDWSQFAAFKKSNADKDSLTSTPSRSTLVPFIPKRGEKDFEPLPPTSLLPAGSSEATLSTHQQHLLSSSRHALYTALSSGSRNHSSKSHNSFTWRPELGRATCDSEDGMAAHGIHFGNIGHFNLERKMLELLPEEAIYMVERGAVELWREYEAEVDGGKVRRVPMSVQQAWAECMGHYDLTPEHYQVYAFLRRLGYVVVRARPIPGTSRPVWTPPPTPLYLRLLKLITHPIFSIRDTLTRVFREVHLLAARLVKLEAEKGAKKKIVKRVKWAKTRVLGSGEARKESLLHGRRWTSYDQIFSRLQIIPTCALHTSSRPLRAPLPRDPSVLTSRVPNPEQHLDPLPSFAEYPYQVFYNVYKPVTKYKKNNPPEPDFRLVVVNGATTSLPTLFELTSLFSTLPLPEGYDENADPFSSTSSTPFIPRNAAPPAAIVGPSAGPAAVAAAKKAQTPAAAPVRKEAAPSSSSPAPQEQATPPTRLQTVLASSLPLFITSRLPASFLPPPPPPPSALQKRNNRGPSGPKPVTPYPFLKLGRRNVLLAVVENGTSSIMRMGEGEFGKVPWRAEGGIGRRE